MINGTGEGPHCGRRVGTGRGRPKLLAFFVGQAFRSRAASLPVCGLICGLICCLPLQVRGETITRRHLDAGRVQFSGIDLNGDTIPDAIAQDNLKKTITFFLADERRNLKRIDSLALPEEERRLMPDVIAEQDLDGDEVRDLLIYNREYIQKYADNETVLARLLGNAIYVGQAKDTYRDFNSCSLTPEARKAVVEKAREIVLPNLP